MAVLQCCVWLLAEMPSSRAVFDLNNHKSGVNRHLRFCPFPKNSEVCRVGCVLFIKPWHHTLHISELKYGSARHISEFFGNRCTATKFSRNTLWYIVVSQKFKLKIISTRFLLPMNSLNELSITLSRLYGGSLSYRYKCPNATHL